VKTLLDSLAFVKRFYDELKKLKEEGRLLSAYYINYTVEDIDYEAILLSSFANNFISKLQVAGNSGKLGLTMSEFELFISKVMNDDQDIRSFEELQESITDFLELYGLSSIEGKARYIYTLLKNQLEGYDYKNMGDDEYRHVGGPILLHATN